MTNATNQCLQAIKEKFTDKLQVHYFKMRKFTEVEPRTSTKRGSNGYYLKSDRSRDPSRENLSALI